MFCIDDVTFYEVVGSQYNSGIYSSRKTSWVANKKGVEYILHKRSRDEYKKLLESSFQRS